MFADCARRSFKLRESILLFKVKEGEKDQFCLKQIDVLTQMITKLMMRT